MSSVFTRRCAANRAARTCCFSSARAAAYPDTAGDESDITLSLPDQPIGRRTNEAFYGISYARVETIPERKATSTMAQKVTTHLVDDLTGDTIEDGKGRTITFGFDGAYYEIDLTDDNADALREAFSDYIAAARKANGRSVRTTAGSAPK
ncbi:histone-like nucleoid-structuring protein Lsr2, partial [Curtobacterium poinsettiae]|uniref:histone-like nucleoid-structuring protein Lsr2 n=1 Tax=Curtobacterium poinsettiae TaxID=159612 RepID=UPI002361FA43